MLTMRNFAVKAHRAYQDGVVLPDGPAFDASDPLAHKAMSLRPAARHRQSSSKAAGAQPRPAAALAARADAALLIASARGSSPRQQQQPPSSAPGALAMQSSLEGRAAHVCAHARRP